MTYEWYFRDLNTDLSGVADTAAAAAEQSDTLAKAQHKAKSYINYHWQPGELKQTVLAAQRFEQQSIALLCKRFEPLIMNALYTELGYDNPNWDDARNDAWTYFLTLIMEYKDERYETLPGLLYLRIHDRLKRDRGHNAYVNSNENFDLDDNTYDQYPAPGSIDDNLLSQQLQQYIKQLPPKQQFVLDSFYNKQQPHSTIAKDLQLSARQEYAIHTQALNTLKQLLN